MSHEILLAPFVAAGAAIVVAGIAAIVIFCALELLAMGLIAGFSALAGTGNNKPEPSMQHKNTHRPDSNPTNLSTVNIHERLSAKPQKSVQIAPQHHSEVRSTTSPRKSKTNNNRTEKSLLNRSWGVSILRSIFSSDDESKQSKPKKTVSPTSKRPSQQYAPSAPPMTQCSYSPTPGDWY